MILCLGWVWCLSLMASQADFAVKVPLGCGNQRTESSTSGFGLRLGGVWAMIAWMKGFLNLGHFQAPYAIIESTMALRDLLTLFTTLSPNLTYKGQSGCQLSNHKKLLSPLPTWYLIRGWPKCLRDFPHWFCTCLTLHIGVWIGKGYINQLAVWGSQMGDPFKVTDLKIISLFGLSNGWFLSHYWLVIIYWTILCSWFSNLMQLVFKVNCLVMLEIAVL